MTRPAAARSGFWGKVPPLEEKFPGVNGEPSGLKNTRRGPSELNCSTGLALPPLNGLGKSVVALTAATLKAAATPEWPLIAPAVLICSLARLAARCKKRPAPELLTMTIRSPRES